MKYITKYLTKYLPYDKCLHIIAGMVIFSLTHFIGILFAIVSVIVIGIGKEVYDHFHPDHTVDIYDALATILGGVLGYICTLPQF